MYTNKYFLIMKRYLGLPRLAQFTPKALVLVSLIVAVAAYLQALNYPFISDDKYYIMGNTKLIGLHISELWRVFTEPYNPLSEFLPLRELSYWFDITLFGLNPAAFRIHNIILYLFCVVLIYVTTLGIWRYFRPADEASSIWAAAVVAALFAINPSHAEAVVWISGRKDVLSGTFSMLALLLAVCAKQEKMLSSTLAALALFAMLAAILSKATAVVVGPVMAMLWLIYAYDHPVSVPEFTNNGKSKVRQSKVGKAKLGEASALQRYRLMWPFASLLLAGCLAMIFAVASSSRVPMYFGVETITRALAVQGWLARLAVSPEGRHFFYPVFEDSLYPAMVGLGGLVLVASAAGAVMLIRKQRSLEGFSLVAFALLSMPYLQLFPYPPPSLVSDRFLFLASWPAILFVVALAWRLTPAPRAVILLAIAIPAVYQTIERPRDWHSFEAMIDKDLSAYPGHYIPTLYKIAELGSKGLFQEASEKAHSISDPEVRNITVKLIQAGYAVNVEARSTGKPQAAIALLLDFGEALINPPARTKWNMPMLSLWQRDIGSLTIFWNLLAADFPNDESVRYNAGMWLLSIHKDKDAIPHLRFATESRSLPESERGKAFASFGRALLNTGNITEAELALLAALSQSQPEMQAHCALAEVYRQTNRLEEAKHAEVSCTQE